MHDPNGYNGASIPPGSRSALGVASRLGVAGLEGVAGRRKGSAGVPMLAELFAGKFLVLYAYLASAMWVHWRGRERHKFTRQLTDHSTFLAPINCFMYAFSAVPNRPILNAHDFPELGVLRENWTLLREEALRLSDQGSIKASEKYDDLGFNSFFRRGWKRFYLKWYGDPLPSARALCPRAVQLLEQIPSVKAAMFAMLPPGGELVAHRDPYAGSVRYHLGLVTPNDERCRIYIDGMPYHWRDGEDIVFDETYIHRAKNETNVNRIILFCDVERPMRFRWARAVNRFLARHLVQASATRNIEGEQVGALNKLFSLVYPIRVKLKALKRRNRRLYYAQKYLVLGGLLALLFLV